MARIDQRIVGQGEQLGEDRIIGGARIAALKIGPPGAPDQQGIAGENAVVHAEAIGIDGVARRVKHLQPDALDGYHIAVVHAHRGDIDRRFGAHHGNAFGAVAKRPHGGDVIGMDMGIDGLDQLEIKLLQELNVTLGTVQHGIDQERLAAFAAGQEIGVCAGLLMKKLAKYHSWEPIRPGPANGLRIFPARHAWLVDGWHDGGIVRRRSARRAAPNPRAADRG
jgi:hypothetical protein